MEDAFSKLRAQLELLEWPDVFLFKFIVKNTSENLAKASSLFTDEAEISFHESKNGNYVSISAKEMMLDADSVIEKYKAASKIEGIISL